jgi:tetratricopeptide (TPR) repeat protein
LTPARGAPYRECVHVTDKGKSSPAQNIDSTIDDKQFQLLLPDAPAHLPGPVKAWRQSVELLSYMPEKPDPNPMFLEKRVYQGSSGRVYPLPFIDRIATQPEKKQWDAIHIENEYLRLMILPEIGGRIHIGYDKVTGYDFFYRQNVIKPSLVGLAGPWISGGVEFNWPQHHRPATFMPVEAQIEDHEDGSITVWCSDHDPMLRMKGMHGVSLHPGQASMDLKVRLFNRTPFTQTFLWWANVATHVHEKYQSFFPSDVRFVADHAKRAVTTFPLSTGHYYGVDYGQRGMTGVPQDEKPEMFVPDGSYAANDLSWYANIPVPTSYMIAGTEADFFGGYDHRAEAGVVHVANHHIAPGKKQWTWGNHDFGYAWDRNLTNDDGPYIELMAGVYTDNQPDFSYLAPWETKRFRQTWFPIHKIGIPKAANLDATLSLQVEGVDVRIGVSVTRAVERAKVTLQQGSQEIARWIRDISVEESVILITKLAEASQAVALHVVVSVEGRTLVEYDSEQVLPAKPPVVAQEPVAPEQLTSVEELYLTGVHLEQYRHATREPELYWQEALRRDPGESRVHNALGLRRLRRGEFERAAEHFEAAILRLTQLNPNPRDGEPYYNLGLTRRYQNRDKEAYEAFYKATWNAAWRGPAYLALAEADAKNHQWQSAADHLRRSLAADADNLNARNLLAVALQHLHDEPGAKTIYAETLSMDPMDIGARWAQGIVPANGKERLDLAFDLLRSGQDNKAMNVLESADFDAHDGSVTMILFTLADVQARCNLPQAQETFRRAMSTPLDYCFPSLLPELQVLEATLARHPEAWAAHYLLGNLLYDGRRYDEAIASWETAAPWMMQPATVWRNLGIAYFNHRHDAEKAIDAFNRAFQANPADGRILYERDQLWKRVGETPQRRIAEMLKYPTLVQLRDDLSVELATLCNQTGRPEDALELLLHRRFQPWEGGEGLVLAQYSRSRLLLCQRALKKGDSAAAIVQLQAALQPPSNLSEARHLLSNQSDIYYWLGVAYEQSGDLQKARSWWERATHHKVDFQQMSVKHLSDRNYWSALAYRKLDDDAAAASLLQEIYEYSFEMESTQPKIDYFATSLPAMLLFHEDLNLRNLMEARFLRAQALAGLERFQESKQLLEDLLTEDGNHTGAADLLQQIPNGGRNGKVN